MLEKKEKFKKLILEQKLSFDNCCYCNVELDIEDILVTEKTLRQVLKEYDDSEMYKLNFSGISLSLYYINEKGCPEMAYGWESIEKNENTEKLIKYIKIVNNNNKDNKNIIYNINFSKFFIEFKKSL